MCPDAVIKDRLNCPRKQIIQLITHAASSCLSDGSQARRLGQLPVHWLGALLFQEIIGAAERM